MLKNVLIRLKRVFSLTIFIMMLIILMTACKPSEVIYKPGSYINEAEGYYSTLIVKVTVNETRILDIEILSHEEPEILSDIVFSRLPQTMKKKNTHDVDIISGATYTSRALIKAVGRALEEAREVVE